MIGLVPTTEATLAALVPTKTALAGLSGLSAPKTTLAALVPTKTALIALVAAETTLATLAALVSTKAALAAAATRGTRDLCGSESQGRANFVDLDLHHGALLALTGFIGALTEATGHDDAHTLGKGFSDILRGLTPDIAGQKKSFLIFPLVRLSIELTRSGSDTEVRHRRTRGGEAELWVSNDVANHSDVCFSLSHA
ncbi:hypothetical protein COCCU_13610 [Corynebacterium occultum]|uniref:Uncharacterized protein n=1 Tax=Corynebacterium occultum TaxID=2675219 RepID=A0A6B8VSN7_9CORY|nr:hypothetical protein COCCU_13610 [Corynebacterium occultum]